MKREKSMFAIFAMGLMIFNMTEVKAQKNENPATISVSLQKRVPSCYENGKGSWVITDEVQQWKADETAIIICDMWNQHWCNGATERVSEMAPFMNNVVSIAREKGILIVHAPSDVVDYYKNYPGRKMIEAAEKYKRIVQIGFQNRSAPYAFSAREYIQSGKLGNIVQVKSYNMLGGGKWMPGPDCEIPAGLDWDAWLGPAPYVNYNPNIHDMDERGGWGSYWAYSGGVLADDASHVLDLARMVIGDPGHPRSVCGWGGNYAWNSEKETPEFQAITYDFGKFTLTCDSGNATNYMKKTPNNIRMDPTLFPDWRTNATRTEIYGTEGLMYLGRHGGGWQVKGEDSKLIAQGGGIFPDKDHQKDFIEALRTRRKPNGDVVQGQFSASLIHLANIAYRVGNKQLHFDPEKERFTDNEDANKLLRTSYREHYRMPENV